MKPGLYEQLVTLGLERHLAALPPERAERRKVDPAEAPRVLTRYLAGALARAFTSLENEERVRAVNAILESLKSSEWSDLVDESLEELLAILPPAIVSAPPERPGLPLTVTELLVNARGEHRVGTEIQREIVSADRVDLLCSFLKWSGYSLVRPVLERFSERGGQLRVLTTCYMGVTQRRVIDQLARLGEVRISYDTRRTRLHAKAWLFHRDTGYSTAYIGSSNMSGAAMLEGLEWNVRVANAESPRVLAKFQATFDSYWNDGEFESYEPERDGERFERATRSEEGQEAAPVYTLQVTPYRFQEEILEQLRVERELHGRFRNLIVAATGTGKTVMSALDYRRVRSSWPRARLLFVAHRDEILEQSLATFRAVLRDGSFGEKWTGRSQATQDQHLFASVQKLQNVALEGIDPEHFDVIVIDEFHHAAAPTYLRLIEFFRPKLLIGLTATPERTDGQNIRRWFDATIELRLWDALERGLLCPFNYFGLHDNTDLRGVNWTRGRYDVQQLEKVYTGWDAYVALILKQLHGHVLDPRKMRALGFCVGVGHARFMASEFCKAGIGAVPVLGDTSEEERREAVRDLREGRIQAIFTVDVFNEGVDVPEVDTVLLLRPTESSTIFLQQLGRGLRLAVGKECLTVLDFIGLARQEFRFDLLYAALLGGTRKELVYHIEQGFPILPSGCSMQLDRVASKIVLDNLRANLRLTRTFLQTELQRVGPEASLGDFLRRSGVELEAVLKHGWIRLRRDVGFESPAGQVPAGLVRLSTLDNLEQIRFYRRYLQEWTCRNQREQRLSIMLHLSLWNRAQAGQHELSELSPAAREELGALLAVLEERVDHLDHALEEHPEVPLRVHCHHSLTDILAAFGELTPEAPHTPQAGVYFHKRSKCDIFFATIQKSERDYSPSTMYRDFAVSPELFHWESQNATRSDSPTGKRYQEHRPGGTHALLFVRERAELSSRLTSPYLFLGPAYYVSHEGDRPMAVTWRLKFPIPIRSYRGFRLTA